MYCKQEIEDRINLINKKIALLKRTENNGIKKIFSKINLNSGKRIRGLILILTAESCGKKINSTLLTYAAALELLHLGSLIHDDIIDDADKRRGIITLHKSIGKELSVLVGDYLFSKVSKIIFFQKNLKVFEVFVNTINKICSGAIEEIYNKFNINLNIKKYFNIIFNKTGSLIQASAEIGALEAKTNKNNYENLKKFGFHIGIAFQIVDDILDIIGKEKVLGKPVGSDIVEGKITLPFIKAFKNASDAEKKNINKIYKQKNINKHKKEIINFIKENNGIKEAMEEAEEHIIKAKKYLSLCELNAKKELLLWLTDYILNRNN